MVTGEYNTEQYCFTFGLCGHIIVCEVKNYSIDPVADPGSPWGLAE